MSADVIPEFLRDGSKFHPSPSRLPRVRNFEIQSSQGLTSEVLTYIRDGSPVWPDFAGDGQLIRDSNGKVCFVVHYDKRAMELFPETLFRAMRADAEEVPR